jgi:hypothetical protein
MLTVEGLVKKYNKQNAVNNISFSLDVERWWVYWAPMAPAKALL